jgi:CRP-like cAMP-binding protein
VPFDDTVFLKRNVDVLTFFTDEQLRHVTAVIERNIYPKNHTIVFKGEISDSFFIIKRGRVSVTSKIGGSPTVELKAGDFFGEVSLLEASAATATIKTVEDDTEILTIPHESFQYLLKQSPLLESALRLRISDRRKAEAASKAQGAQ